MSFTFNTYRCAHMFLFPYYINLLALRTNPVPLRLNNSTDCTLVLQESARVVYFVREPKRPIYIHNSFSNVIIVFLWTACITFTPLFHIIEPPVEKFDKAIE